MYFCPLCLKTFETEEEAGRHSLKCWKERNPYHKSKPAPHSENIEKRAINEDMFDFFSSLQKGD